MTRKVFYILFFLRFIFSYSQQIMIINTTEKPIELKYFSKKLTLQKNEKQTISGEGKLTFINLNHHIQKLYLESNEKLTISVTDRGWIYKGDKDSVYTIIGRIHLTNYGKIPDYQHIAEKNNPKQYINTSELILSDALARIEKIENFDHSTKSYKRLKEYIIYNWLTTSTMGLFSGTTAFQKEVTEHYYKKYIEKDIQNFQCDSTFKYSVIDFLAENKKKFGINLPSYPIVMASYDDEKLQYFPTTCQQDYFENRYQFLKSKKDTRQEIYKKILKDKFQHNID